MRLFTYYAVHSIKNQLKKLFKTWVLVFIILCAVIGGIIGFSVAKFSEAEDGEEPAVEVEVIEEEQEESPLLTLGIKTEDIIELIAGGIILAVFVFEAMGADKNGSRIFLPADVNLLFASPMKPQSVLMFRLLTQLGIAIFAGIYMLFQIPNLTMNLGLSIWAALAIIATWCFTIIIAKLLQVLLYTICSTNPKSKGYLRRGIYAVLVLTVVSYIIYCRQSGEGYFKGAVLFFNSRISRIIPFWGWLKGFCAFAVKGNVTGAALSFAAILAGAGLLIYIIWHINADFYEDAMAKSEETAELLERASSEKSTGLVFGTKRKKDRKDTLRRDGMHYGQGANVFFFKTLYNRFRFSHLGFLTKTMETYLVLGIGMAAFCRFAVQTRSIAPTALTLAGLAFFRSLGNPLEQDTKTDYFIMIPESVRAKLFWSLMGGTANCFLDVLPVIVIASVLLGTNPVIVLAWIPFIVSVDFYATNVGTFINLSVPVSAGKTLKQIVQVMFVYFGLLPDIGIIAAGAMFSLAAQAVIGAAVLNIVLGFIFFAFSPLFIEPK